MIKMRGAENGRLWFGYASFPQSFDLNFEDSSLNTKEIKQLKHNKLSTLKKMVPPNQKATRVGFALNPVWRRRH